MEEKQIKTVCFTGHRRIPAAIAPQLPVLLKREIEALCHRGAVCFRAGGAIGFDTVAALAVLDMKKKYPHIRLELILPCRDQDAHWSEEDRWVYAHILSRADGHCFLFEQYMEGCMLERDRRLVAGSDVCVAFCTRSYGGTAFTCAQAIKNGVELINLFDMLDRSLIESVRQTDLDAD